jgi:hypothetical protein
MHSAGQSILFNGNRQLLMKVQEPPKTKAETKQKIGRAGKLKAQQTPQK